MKSHKNKKQYSLDDEGDLWLSLSDLAMGGFVIFLIIAVVFLVRYSSGGKDIGKIPKLKGTIDSLETVIDSMGYKIDSLVNVINKVARDTGIFEPLVDFNSEMIEVLPKEGIIRFRTAGNKELFPPNSDLMSQEFNISLKEFLPEFIKVINGRIDRIDEIRIEGHTDTDCIISKTDFGCYVENLDLSVRRAKNVLLDILGHKDFPKGTDAQKIRKRLTATGYSFSKQLNSNGQYTEDKAQMSKDRSRRVELRVFLKTR